PCESYGHIHMAVANGFPPQVYQPLLQPLAQEYNVVSLPPRPMWTNPPPSDEFTSWEETAVDLIKALRLFHLKDVIGIGHSLGAVATMFAATKKPCWFRGIVLLDPTIFPPRLLWTLKAMRIIGLEGRMPLVRRALNRRAHFADAQEAFQYWRGKKLFEDWTDEALWLYVTGLTAPNDNGDDGLMLTWSPEWEARYYATIYTESWKVIGQLEGLLPILVIRGTYTNTFFEPAAELMQKRVPSMTYAEVEGGHLFPQSAPNPTRDIIEDWLETLD
ncbi:MAG: alpha/beta hydrolase, partial [Chloroflexota bacterium]